MAEPRVSGRLVRSCLRYLKERIGDGAVQSVLAEVAPALRDASRTEWLPVVAFVELLGQVEARYGDPATDRLIREMTRATMAAAVSSVWATFLADATPDSMLDRAGAFWSVSYDAGRLVVIDRGAGRARLAVVEWPDPPPVVSVLLSEACAVMVARLGARQPRAVESRVDGLIEIEISW